MDKLLDFIKHNTKNAWTTVMRAKRQFVPFFLAIFLIQFVLFSVALTFDSAEETQAEMVEEECPYHLIVSGLSENQYRQLYYDRGSIGTYGVYRLVQTDRSERENYQNAYIYFELDAKTYGFFDKLGLDDSLPGLYEEFTYRYTAVSPLLEAEGISLSLTPLYTLPDSLSALRTTRNWAVLIAAVLSAITMIALYRIRTNNEKFTYGIYATFGANTARLRFSAFYELLVCSVLTILPAYYLACGAGAIIFSIGSFYPFQFHLFKPLTVLLIFLLSVVILLLAVYLPMKLIAYTEPMKLIVAEDNSNLASAPRGKKAGRGKISFPGGYTRLSTVRFRKHHVLLAATSAFFSILFIAGLYLTGLYQKQKAFEKVTLPEFTVSFNLRTEEGEKINIVPPEYLDKFRGINGVASAHRSYSNRYASDEGIYATFQKDQVSGGKLLKSPFDKDEYLTSDLNLLCATDGDLPSWYSEMYEITGDISKVGATENGIPLIAIATTKGNANTYNFSLGDTITLSRYLLDEDGFVVRLDGEKLGPVETEPPAGQETGESAPPAGTVPPGEAPPAGTESAGSDAPEDATTAKEKYEAPPALLLGNDLLQYRLETYAYEHHTYKICAIIENCPSIVTGTPLILSSEEYVRLTGEDFSANELNITLDTDLDAAGYARVQSEILALCNQSDSIKVTTNYVYSDQRFESHTPYVSSMILVLSITLILIPILWFFSQAMFFRKRENEFYILQSISATLPTIRKLYMHSALIMFPIGILSLGFSALAVLLLHVATKYWLPVLFTALRMTITPLVFSPLLYLVCFAITVLSSMISAYIPFLRYRKRFLSEQQQDALYQD